LGNGLELAGTVKTGISVQSADDGNDDTEDTKVKFWHDDADLLGEFTFTYTGDWGGAKARFAAQAPGYVAKDDTPTLSDKERWFRMPFAYGWVNLLDNKVVLTAGHIDGNAWGLGKITNAFDPSFDAVKGVRVEFKVVDGLNFGFALPVDQVTAYAYDSSFEAKTVDRTIGQVFGGAVFGALYQSGFISGVAAARLTPATDGKVHGLDPNGSKYGETEAFAEIIAGVEVHPIEPLKVGLNTQIDTRKFNKNADQNINAIKIGYSKIGLKGNFVTGPLTVNGKGVVVVHNSDDAGTYVNDIWVEKVGDLGFEFELGGEYKILSNVTGKLYFGSGNAAYFAGNGLWVKPAVAFSLGSASVEIFDRVGRIGADEAKIKDAKTGASSAIENKFQINFAWSF
jgi:hypothetical protein